MNKTILFLFSSLIATSAQAYYYFPYTFSELENELSNLSRGAIQVKPGLPTSVKDTTFQKVGVTFFTDQNPSGLDAQDFFSIDVSKFNGLMKSPDFLTAKREFYSRLTFNRNTQRYYRPYGYLASWRSLFHPQIKSLTIDPTVIDQDMIAMKPGERANSNSPYFSASLNREVDAMSGSELTIGNDLDLLLNNDAFEHKIDLIRRSKKSFIGMVMVLACDHNGSRFVDELIAAKNRGVDVKVMHEGVWTRITNSACVKRMRKAGIDVLLISDMLTNHRVLGVVHNKFWIRDEEEAIIGGQNLVDAETESNGFNDKMHDSEVWIHSGPEVTTLLYQYAKLWHRYGKKDQKARIVQYLVDSEARLQQERDQGLRGEKNYDAWFANPETRMKGVCRSVVQKFGKEDLIGPVLQRYAEAAKVRIMATTPNVKYKDKKNKPVINNLLNTLTDRANDGVKVDVIANGIDGMGGAVGDWFRNSIKGTRSVASRTLLRLLYQFAGVLTSKSDFKELERLQDSSPGIRAWTYTSYIHAKQMVFDRTLVSIGSFNLDYHSSQTNHEAQIFCLDEKLITQVEKEFTLDLANSVPVTR